MRNCRGAEWNRWDLHVHTASSYDYKYKGADADELLCQMLAQNDIKAVAITDHFKIDKGRIESLRSKAPKIVFFPGVELRTDKGANNLHLILIFSEESNLDVLSADFEAIMLRQKAKSATSNETIYWDFEDIVNFAKEKDALISIHAGRKTNGIDSEITNALPVREAIKEDIAGSVHFFEIGQKRDIEDYEHYVFKSIEPKPLILCSDNHTPKDYTVKEQLWIKAALTFAGLKQCLYHPQERVYIGNVPPILDRVTKNKQNNISLISCSRIDNPTNKTYNWFNFKIPLNPGMVAVIGNKGSGKSAFSDIIGHLCRCTTMDNASFLTEKRFKKPPQNYANDYSATLTWLDEEPRTNSLGANQNESSIEDAQYLPQKYIEDVCNDLGDMFQEEIDNVIFSYVDKAERGDAQNLNELIKLKSKPLKIEAQTKRAKLNDINSRIIELERKKTKGYRKMISDRLEKVNEILKRHEKSKPVTVEKPEPNGPSGKYQVKLKKLNQDIKNVKNELKKGIDKISEINTCINDLRAVIAQIVSFQTQFIEMQNQIEALAKKYNFKNTDCITKLITPKTFLEEQIKTIEKEKNELQDSISVEENGLSTKLAKLEAEKKSLLSSADIKEKLYQQYLTDLTAWQEKEVALIGTKDIDGSATFFKYELDYIDTKLDSEYSILITERDKITKRLFQGIAELSKIYQDIYTPIQGEILEILHDLEDSISFHAEVSMKETSFTQDILNFIDQRYNGKYGRSHDSVREIDTIIKNINFENEDDVMAFVHDMTGIITSDFETAGKRVPKRQEFYDFIFGLTYVGVNFKLKMGQRSLEELSPGERGIVLLIFYLALSKESKPIIIDQPEDNLDNQSVYSKLVPCICRAKQKRQIIIVTHNPNIAVACDAEQIIYCEKDKKTNQIRYEAGAIEDPVICNHVIDVLEGTMPAFDLRRHKYDDSKSYTQKGYKYY